MTNVCKFKVVSKKIMLAVHLVLFFKKVLLKIILKVNLMFRKYMNILLKNEVLCFLTRNNTYP